MVAYSLGSVIKYSGIEICGYTFQLSVSLHRDFMSSVYVEL